MEHPSGELHSALEAITSAMQRLDELGMDDRWIIFSGQGQGNKPDSHHIEEVAFSGRTFDLKTEIVDVPGVLQFAGLDDRIKVITTADGKITLPDATPQQLALFLDAILRKHFGIRAFDGEGDYAVGAEW